MPHCSRDGHCQPQRGVTQKPRAQPWEFGSKPPHQGRTGRNPFRTTANCTHWICGSTECNVRGSVTARWALGPVDLIRSDKQLACQLDPICTKSLKLHSLWEGIQAGSLYLRTKSTHRRDQLAEPETRGRIAHLSKINDFSGKIKNRSGVI